MINKLIHVLVFFIAIPACGQDSTKFDGHKWQAPYALPTPEGWTVERFLLPPFFAPEISFHGVEDIRFAPGWSNAQKDDYWSYMFLWYLDEKPSLEKKDIENYLQFYYTGLIKINSDSVKHAHEKSLKVIAKLSSANKSGDEAVSYTGEIQLRDFISRKPMTLHCKVHSKLCVKSNKTALVFELSPQPFTNDIWISLDKLWLEFRCKKDAGF